MRVIRRLGPFVAVFLAILVAWGFTAGAWVDGVTVRMPLDTRWSLWWTSEAIFRLDRVFDAPVVWAPVGSPFYTTLSGLLVPLLGAPFMLILGADRGDSALLAVIAGGNVVGGFVAARRLTGRVGASLAASLLYGLNPSILDAFRSGDPTAAFGWFLPWVLVAFWELPGSPEPWGDAGEVGIGVVAVTLSWWAGGVALGVVMGLMVALWLLRPDRVDAVAQAVRVAIVATLILAVPALPIAQQFAATGELPSWFGLTTQPVRLAWTAWVIGPAALTLPRARPWAVLAVAMWLGARVPHPAALGLVIDASMAMAAAVALGGMSRILRRFATLAAAVACFAESARPPGLALAVEPVVEGGEAPSGGGILNLPLRARHDDRAAQMRHRQMLLVGPGEPPAGWLLFVQRNPLLATLWRIEGGERGDTGMATLADATRALGTAGFRWITIGDSVPTTVVAAWSEVLDPLLGERKIAWDLTHLRAAEAADAPTDVRQTPRLQKMPVEKGRTVLPSMDGTRPTSVTPHK